MTKEEIYDEQIAPLMTQIISLAQQNEIPFHATFGLEEGLFCTTHISGFNSPKSTPFLLLLMLFAAKTEGNFDAFILEVVKWAKKNGHDSLFLQQVGVPTEPEETT